MTTIPTAIRLAHLSLAALLLGGMLIASAGHGQAAEANALAASSTSSVRMQGDTAGAATDQVPAHSTVLPAGTVGFGWG